jgi:lipopolysaccharide biosynthesis glycosyltransferase
VGDSGNVIQIVLAVFDASGKYSKYAGVVMTSIFQRTQNLVCVTILHDETLTEDNRSRFIRTAEVFGQTVRFIDVSEAVLALGQDIDDIAREFTRGTLFRLLIPDVIDAPKVIYLDCDIAVNMDIAELWGVGVDNLSLAVADRNKYPGTRETTLHIKIRAWAMRFDELKYFNSGVLLMNLDRMRKRKLNLVESARAFSMRYRLCADFLDQDFLNAFFQGDVLFIDRRFNRTDPSANIENAILHFTGYERAWEPHPVVRTRDHLFWETLIQSEWRDQLIESIFDMFKNGRRCHYHTSDCYRRILYRLKQDLLTNSLPARFIKDLRVVLKELGARHRESSCG